MSASGTARVWIEDNDSLYFVINVFGLTAAADARLYVGATGQNGNAYATFCAPCLARGEMLAAGMLQLHGMSLAQLLNHMRTFNTYIELRLDGAPLLRGQVRNVSRPTPG